MDNVRRELLGLKPKEHQEMERKEEEKKLLVQLLRGKTNEERAAELKFENDRKEAEIKYRKIDKMTLEEMLVYFNVIKPMKKRKKPLTDEEVSSKLDMMLQMKVLELHQKKLPKTTNYMERAKREEDAPLVNDQRKKKCLNPEEEHKKFLDLCRGNLNELQKNIKFVGFNETEKYDWKKELEDNVLDQRVWDGPIELD